LHPELKEEKGMEEKERRQSGREGKRGPSRWNFALELEKKRGSILCNSKTGVEKGRKKLEESLPIKNKGIFLIASSLSVMEKKDYGENLFVTVPLGEKEKRRESFFSWGRRRLWSLST